MSRGDMLAGLIDAYELDDIDRLFNAMASNVDFFMLLDDVIGAVTTPRVLATNCARAIDAIRHLISPGGER